MKDLEAFLESSGKSAADYRNQMKPKEARSKVIDGILASRTDCKECKPVYEKYQKIFFKKTKEKFKQEHPEVARYAKAAAYLAKHPDDKDSTQKELQEEQEKAAEWQAKIRELEKQKQEEENSQIVQAVRSLKLTPAQLMAFLNDPKNSLTASGHTDPKPEAPEKEDTAHEEN